MFKVGDLVTIKGATYCKYSFTNEYAVCKVLEILNEEEMIVKVVRILNKEKFYRKATGDGIISKEIVDSCIYFKSYKVCMGIFECFNGEEWD